MITHGMKNTRPYRIWTQLKNRCDNKKNVSYKYYGAIGVKYCKSWEKFENFWRDMKLEYADDLSIDRIDNRKGYSKNNCRWVKLDIQSLNKRRTIYVEHNGIKKPLVVFSRELGIPYSTSLSRYYKGWSVEEILSLGRCPKFSSKYRGVTYDKRCNKWLVFRMFGRKKVNYGAYVTEEEAGVVAMNHYKAN